MADGATPRVGLGRVEQRADEGGGDQQWGYGTHHLSP
jgi:hypothetical protein